MRLQARVFVPGACVFACAVFLACGGSNAGTLKVQNDASSGGSGSSGSSGSPAGSGEDEGGSGAGSGASSTGEDGSSGSSGTGSGATSGSMSEGGSGSGTSSGSGNPTPAPIPVPDGGAPSDPGSVLCNHAECPVSTSVCCQSQGADGGASEACQDFKAQCSGTTQACNEASDCPTGSVCCWGVVGIGVQGDTFCGGGGKGCAGGPSASYISTFQTCRTDAECGKEADGGAIPCLPQVCTDPYNAANTIKLEACAVPSAPNYHGIAYPHDGYLAFCVAAK